MNKITLVASFAFLFISSIGFSQNQRIEFKPRQAEFEYFEYRNDSIFPLKTPIDNSASRIFESKLPYPIIFIHGLNSSSETWNDATDYYDTQYSFTYGGRFDFCLNADNNNATTNKNFFPTAGADIAAFESFVQNGDYYYVNFNVNPNGSVGTTVLSNQSAVAKQGAAVKVAVQRVMAVTGKDKVILVGHSMGGLASREYIQNSYNWQADNQHHVAKFLTLGTPHGGSNASDIPGSFLTGTETRSEALRDLKITYYYSGEPSRFLFGGIEINNSSNMNEHLFGPDYWNIDVNCNGTIGDNIVGLNQKPIDNIIDFSCVLGRINGSSSDGVVTETSGTLGNYFTGTGLTYPIKYFYYTSIGIENHTALPSQYYEIMQGLDEPNVKELSYRISTNKDYIGYTTVQNPTGADNDFFKFTIADNVNAVVSVTSIVTSSMNGTILNSAGTAVGASQNNSGNTLSFTRTLTPGDYFLRLTSTSPTNTNYQTPYQFNITTTLSTGDNSFASFTYYPNPVKDILHLDNISLTKASIYSLLGQLIETKSFENSTSNTLDLTNLESGIYLIVLENDLEQKTIKVIKE
ncbi:T9SS type A sorting domain-containing protein [Flavobacterium cheniae]|uniref:Putative secreted protein (Por secretion system target) n=1 Tax=Flavobacterium cheniae TaxID=295428 RepID=A0A562KSP4_9FLAO|nr:T9SS type A sorting domain-containing protein [Flavobacterium cheniae]TDR25419.1 putative secreted protein (Por secretion system target) [Flavobacterium cheniae]TWH98394.1 putative secreted protein (Por secretion system target) [Flavobacterium cheniae]